MTSKTQSKSICRGADCLLYYLATDERLPQMTSAPMRKERLRMGITQFFRQIPRLLQVLSLLGFLLLLAAIVTLTAELVTAASAFVVFLNGPQTSSLAGQPPLRLLGTGMSLGLLGFGCVWPTIMYVSLLRRPGRAPWPDTWQMQVLATLALVLLPLFSLALPLLFPSPLFIASGLLFVGQSAINLVEAGLLFAATSWSMIVAIS